MTLSGLGIFLAKKDPLKVANSEERKFMCSFYSIISPLDGYHALCFILLLKDLNSVVEVINIRNS